MSGLRGKEGGRDGAAGCFEKDRVVGVVGRRAHQLADERARRAGANLAPSQAEQVGVLDGVTLQSTRWTDTNGDGSVNAQDNAAPNKCHSICEVVRIP